MRDSSALRAELQALAGLETGQLDIAAGPYVAEDLVGPAVARCINERPQPAGACDRGRPGEVEREVLSGRYDLGLGGIASQTPHPTT